MILLSGRFPLLLLSIPNHEKSSPVHQKLLLLLVPYYDAILNSIEDILEIIAEIILSFIATPINAMKRKYGDGHEYMYITRDPKYTSKRMKWNIIKDIDIRGIRAFAIPHEALNSGSICDFPEEWLIPLVRGNDYFRSHRKRVQHSLRKAAKLPYTEAVTLFALASEEGFNISRHVHRSIKKYRESCDERQDRGLRSCTRQKRLNIHSEYSRLTESHRLSGKLKAHVAKLAKFQHFINDKELAIGTKRAYDSIVASLISSGAKIIPLVPEDSFLEHSRTKCTIYKLGDDGDLDIFIRAGDTGFNSALRGAILIQKPQLVQRLIQIQCSHIRLQKSRVTSDYYSKLRFVTQVARAIEAINALSEEARSLCSELDNMNKQRLNIIHFKYHTKTLQIMVDSYRLQTKPQIADHGEIRFKKKSQIFERRSNLKEFSSSSTWQNFIKSKPLEMYFECGKLVECYE